MEIQRQNDAFAYRLAVPLWQKIPTDLTWMEPTQQDPDPHFNNDEWTAANGKEFSKLNDMAEHNPTGKWYHTSDHPLKPGDKIIPGGGESPDSEFYEEQDYDDDDTGLPPYNNQNRQKYVWLSPNLDEADRWQKSLVTQHIYEVKPGDRPQRWNFDGTNGWVAPHAWVVRELSPEDVLRENPPQKPSSSEVFDVMSELAPWSEYPFKDKVIPPREEREKVQKLLEEKIKEKYPNYTVPRGGIYDLVEMFDYHDSQRAAAVIVLAENMIREAERVEFEWQRSFDTGDWALTAQPPTGPTRVVITKPRTPNNLSPW